MLAAKLEKISGKKSKDLTERPEEDAYTSWYKKAFYCIDRSRQAVMGAGYIPLTAITDYANNIGHVEEDLHDFVDIIMSMDNEYLQHVHKKK